MAVTTGACSYTPISSTWTSRPTTRQIEFRGTRDAEARGEDEDPETDVLFKELS